MGSSLTQTSLHYFTLNTKWRGGHSLPFMWYWKAAWEDYLVMSFSGMKPC